MTYCRVLLVDDSDQSKYLIDKSMNKSDITLDITKANKSSQVSDLLDENKFDVIFINPAIEQEQNELEFMEKISEIRYDSKLNKKTDIVALVDEPNHATAAILLKNGIKDYIYKDESSLEAIRQMIRFSLYPSFMPRRTFMNFLAKR